MKIPRIMSTQHPDNVNIPFFAQNSVMQGDDEVKEAFYAYSHLGAEEQLWDAEGKEVDNFVVKKLFSRYGDYFQKNILGKDKLLTFRIPNPDVEKNEGKILLESLNSIPRNFDIGKAFYGKDIAPIFEVMIPMCFSDKNLIRVHEYYKQFIAKNQERKIYAGDITVGEWLGKFNPQDIRVTPLFETKDAILNSDRYVKKYIQFEKIKELQRVWFARSDPALNYGSTAAVLMGKVGLQRLHKLQEETSIPIYPIIGCGSAPFRGNFNPVNAENMLFAYPSIQTFTIQSAFKYDYGPKKVIESIEKIKNTKRKKPVAVDEKFATEMIDKIEEDYQKSIRVIAPTVNLMSQFVPGRRKRKLHTDLFGYARENAGVTLPRAIKFCASLYSLGLPPDILGLSTLRETELDKIRESYRTIDKDLADAMQYFNKDNLSFFPIAIRRRVLKAAKLFDFEVNQEHQKITTNVVRALKKGDTISIQEGILNAGRIRRFLG